MSTRFKTDSSRQESTAFVPESKTKFSRSSPSGGKTNFARDLRKEIGPIAVDYLNTKHAGNTLSLEDQVFHRTGRYKNQHCFKSTNVGGNIPNVTSRTAGNEATGVGGNIPNVTRRTVGNEATGVAENQTPIRNQSDQTIHTTTGQITGNPVTTSVDLTTNVSRHMPVQSRSEGPISLETRMRDNNHPRDGTRNHMRKSVNINSIRNEIVTEIRSKHSNDGPPPGNAMSVIAGQDIRVAATTTGLITRSAGVREQAGNTIGEAREQATIAGLITGGFTSAKNNNTKLVSQGYVPISNNDRSTSTMFTSATVHITRNGTKNLFTSGDLKKLPISSDIKRDQAISTNSDRLPAGCTTRNDRLLLSGSTATTRLNPFDNVCRSKNRYQSPQNRIEMPPQFLSDVSIHNIQNSTSFNTSFIQHNQNTPSIQNTCSKPNQSIAKQQIQNNSMSIVNNSTSRVNQNNSDVVSQNTSMNVSGQNTSIQNESSIHFSSINQLSVAQSNQRQSCMPQSDQTRSSEIEQNLPNGSPLPDISDISSIYEDEETKLLHDSIAFDMQGIPPMPKSPEKLQDLDPQRGSVSRLTNAVFSGAGTNTNATVSTTSDTNAAGVLITNGMPNHRNRLSLSKECTEAFNVMPSGMSAGPITLSPKKGSRGNSPTRTAMVSPLIPTIDAKIRGLNGSSGATNAGRNLTFSTKIGPMNNRVLEAMKEASSTANAASGAGNSTRRDGSPSKEGSPLKGVAKQRKVVDYSQSHNIVCDYINSIKAINKELMDSSSNNSMDLLKSKDSHASDQLSTFSKSTAGSKTESVASDAIRIAKVDSHTNSKNPETSKKSGGSGISDPMDREHLENHSFLEKKQIIDSKGSRDSKGSKRSSTFSSESLAKDEIKTTVGKSKELVTSDGVLPSSVVNGAGIQTESEVENLANTPFLFMGEMPRRCVNSSTISFGDPELWITSKDSTACKNSSAGRVHSSASESESENPGAPTFGIKSYANESRTSMQSALQNGTNNDGRKSQVSQEIDTVGLATLAANIEKQLGFKKRPKTMFKAFVPTGEEDDGETESGIANVANNDMVTQVSTSTNANLISTATANNVSVRQWKFELGDSSPEKSPGKPSSPEKANCNSSKANFSSSMMDKSMDVLGISPPTVNKIYPAVASHTNGPRSQLAIGMNVSSLQPPNLGQPTIDSITAHLDHSNKSTPPRGFTPSSISPKGFPTGLFSTGGKNLSPATLSPGTIESIQSLFGPSPVKMTHISSLAANGVTKGDQCMSKLDANFMVKQAVPKSATKDDQLITSCASADAILEEFLQSGRPTDRKAVSNHLFSTNEKGFSKNVFSTDGKQLTKPLFSTEGKELTKQLFTPGSLEAKTTQYRCSPIEGAVNFTDPASPGNNLGIQLFTTKNLAEYPEKSGQSPSSKEQFSSPLKEQLSSQLKEQGSSSSKEQLSSQLKEQVSSSLKEQVASPLKEQVSSPTKEQASSPLKEQVASPLKEQASSISKEPISSGLKGQFFHQLPHQSLAGNTQHSPEQSSPEKTDFQLQTFDFQSVQDAYRQQMQEARETLMTSENLPMFGRNNGENVAELSPIITPLLSQNPDHEKLLVDKAMERARQRVSGSFSAVNPKSTVGVGPESTVLPKDRKTGPVWSGKPGPVGTDKSNDPQKMALSGKITANADSKPPIVATPATRTAQKIHTESSIIGSKKPELSIIGSKKPVAIESTRHKTQRTIFSPCVSSPENRVSSLSRRFNILSNQSVPEASSVSKKEPKQHSFGKKEHSPERRRSAEKRRYLKEDPTEKRRNLTEESAEKRGKPTEFLRSGLPSMLSGKDVSNSAKVLQTINDTEKRHSQRKASSSSSSDAGGAANPPVIRARYSRGDVPERYSAARDSMNRPNLNMSNLSELSHDYRDDERRSKRDNSNSRRGRSNLNDAALKRDRRDQSNRSNRMRDKSDGRRSNSRRHRSHPSDRLDRSNSNRNRNSPEETEIISSKAPVFECRFISPGKKRKQLTLKEIASGVDPYIMEVDEKPISTNGDSVRSSKDSKDISKSSKDSRETLPSRSSKETHGSRSSKDSISSVASDIDQNPFFSARLVPAVMDAFKKELATQFDKRHQYKSVVEKRRSRMSNENKNESKTTSELKIKSKTSCSSSNFMSSKSSTKTSNLSWNETSSKVSVPSSSQENSKATEDSKCFEKSKSLTKTSDHQAHKQIRPHKDSRSSSSNGKNPRSDISLINSLLHDDHFFEQILNSSSTSSRNKGTNSSVLSASSLSREIPPGEESHVIPGEESHVAPEESYAEVQDSGVENQVENEDSRIENQAKIQESCAQNHDSFLTHIASPVNGSPVISPNRNVKKISTNPKNSCRHQETPPRGSPDNLVHSVLTVDRYSENVVFPPKSIPMIENEAETPMFPSASSTMNSIPQNPDPKLEMPVFDIPKHMQSNIETYAPETYPEADPCQSNNPGDTQTYPGLRRSSADARHPSDLFRARQMKREMELEAGEVEDRGDSVESEISRFDIILKRLRTAPATKEQLQSVIEAAVRSDIERSKSQGSQSGSANDSITDENSRSMQQGIQYSQSEHSVSQAEDGLSQPEHSHCDSVTAESSFTLDASLKQRSRTLEASIDQSVTKEGYSCCSPSPHSPAPDIDSVLRKSEQLIDSLQQSINDIL